MAIASAPSAVWATTGRRTMASVEMMPTWGWLMIGIVSTDPAEPLLEIVNVPPWISSGLSLRVRARLARSLISRASALQPLGLGAADHRRQQTLVVEVDGDAEIDVVVDDELVVADAGVEVRELGQPVDDRPGDERQVREAEALRST